MHYSLLSSRWFRLFYSFLSFDKLKFRLGTEAFKSQCLNWSNGLPNKHPPDSDLSVEGPIKSMKNLSLGETLSKYSNKYISHTLRALSKGQNWPAGPWLDKTYWQWNRLYPSPSRIILYLRFDWPGWLVLIKTEILITMGRGWPVGSDWESSLKDTKIK